MSKSKSYGTLYVVATPIGNLADFSSRAQAILSQVKGILCEDTRHSRRLMEHFGIQTLLVSLHEHNEREKTQWVIEQLQNGEDWALISDAGTPLISDPGYVLVSALHQAGMAISPVPGTSSVITALSVAGLPTDRFSFMGFVPPKTQARIKFYEDLATRSETLVCFESPHRILKSLVDLKSVLGENHLLSIQKELTKSHEGVFYGTVTEAQLWLKEDVIAQKGEYVLLIAGQREKTMLEDASVPVSALIEQLSTWVPGKALASLIAEHTDLKKNAVYERILEAKKN